MIDNSSLSWNFPSACEINVEQLNTCYFRVSYQLYKDRLLKALTKRRFA